MRISKGFTMLELIAVITIFIFLVAIALPKLFSTVEFSKSKEAMDSIKLLRDSIERCYIYTKDYSSCTGGASLDIEDPANSPGAHFTYATAPVGSYYSITATRNSYEGGNSTDTIVFEYRATNVARSGTGAFSSIK